MATIDDAIEFAHEYARLQLACSTELFAATVAQEKAAAAGRKPPKRDLFGAKSAQKRIAHLAARGAYLPGDGCSGETSGKKPKMENQERKLFAVTKHKSKRGDLFVLHLSGTMWDVDSYAERVFVVEVDGELKFIGRSQACSRCGATGKHNGKPCDVCRTGVWRKGIGAWPTKEGVNIMKPGKHVEVRKLLAPTRPEHRAHYDAL